MIKLIKNKRGQFFIAAAVIIIATLAIIFNYLPQVKSIDNPNLFADDLGFAFSNIMGEYGMTVEYVLANVSWQPSLTGSQINTALDGNLSTFQNFTNNITKYSGISISSSYTINEALNYSMNVSVSLTITSTDSNLTSNFDVLRAISVDIDPSFQSTTPCEFNSTIRKEYSEPITGMGNSNLEEVRIDGSDVTGGCDMNETANDGVYNISCSANCDGNEAVMLAISDPRNVYGNDTQTAP